MRRPSLLLLCVFSSCCFVFASDLKIQVLDPDQRSVSSARVAIYSGNTASVQSTSPDGTVSFANLPDGSYRVQVQAAGFSEANESVQVPSKDASAVSIRLSVQKPNETIVVSAASTPLSEAESGALFPSSTNPRWTCATPPIWGTLFASRRVCHCAPMGNVAA